MPVDKKRVATVITRLVRGGAQYIALNVHSSLSDSKYEKFFITGDSDSSEGGYDDLADDLSITPIFNKYLKRNISPVNDFFALISLISFFKKNKIDIVYTNTSKAGIIGRFAAKFAGIDNVIHSPHGHIFSKNSNISGVTGYPLRIKIFLFLEKMAAKCCKKIVVVTDSEADELLSLGVGEKSQYKTIPNGLDIDSFFKGLEDPKIVRNRLKIDSNMFVIGIVARLTPEKGHKLLLEALAQLENRKDEFCIVIVGDGPMREELAKFANSLNLKNIIFTGLEKNPASIINIFDLSVTPSSYEAFGMVILEAMALDVPVLASNVGGIPEIITDGVDGVLFEYGNVVELSHKIEDLMDSSDKRLELAKNASNTLKSKFSIEIMLKKYQQLFDNMNNF